MSKKSIVKVRTVMGNWVGSVPITRDLVKFYGEIFTHL